MSLQRRKSGFGRTHLTCPCPAQERGCFSEFADQANTGSGYCFACSRVVFGKQDRTIDRSRTSPEVQQQPVEQKYVDRGVVFQSISDVLGFVSRYSNTVEYNNIRALYRDCLSDGVAHLQARIDSGWEAYANSRIQELSVQLNTLPSFISSFISLTHAPEVLQTFTIGRGINNPNDTSFWIAGTDGHFRNAQIIRYENLERCKDTHPKFLFYANNGYRIDEFFGAEQLQPGYASWTGLQFHQDRDVILVESPKSALLATALHPEHIWLASMGVSGVTHIRAQKLARRNVKVLFDNDQAGFEGAKRARTTLLNAGVNAQILSPSSVFSGSRPDGWDIGDEVVQILGDNHVQ